MYRSTIRKPDGYERITTEEGVLERDTHQCVHCGLVFAMVKGSGRKRGFCMKCMGITCGNQQCSTCVPLEMFLDHMEGTKTQYSGTILDQFGRPFVKEDA